MTRLHTALCLIPALAALLLLGSCGEKNVFEDYEDVNLISALDFSEEDLWTIDYGAPMDFDYMLYESAGTVTEAVSGGPVEGAAVYRLNIVNLMPNGDFIEDTSADWVLKRYDDPTVYNSTIGVSETRLNFNIKNKSERFDYDLSNLLDGLSQNANYILRFSVRNGGTLTMLIHAGDPSTVDPTAWRLSAYVTETAFPMENLDPAFSIGESTVNYLSIGDFDGSHEGNPVSGYLDNIRISRADIHHYLYTDLPYNFTYDDGSEEGLPLIHGAYRFSAYIKNDPTVTPSVQNRFGAPRVTIGLSELGENALDEIIPVRTNYTVHTSSDEGADWSEWTLVSAVLNIQPEEPEDPARATVRLFIYPTDLNNQDVGSILITSPSLVFLPEGE